MLLAVAALLLLLLLLLFSHRLCHASLLAGGAMRTPRGVWANRVLKSSGLVAKGLVTNMAA
jgi:hypothetical protein